MKFVNLIQKPNPKLFFSKKDTSDPRMGDLIKTWKNEKHLSELLCSADIAILGIPDDTGIVRNKGRAGAKKGPNAIRKNLYKFTTGFENKINKLKIIDIGNIKIDKNIARTHQNVEIIIKEITKKNVIPIIIGGGHDFAYPDMAGFINGYSEKRKQTKIKIGQINVDSHFDVRDMNFGITSGTPFYRILELANNPLQGKNFVEFGIQEFRNSKTHKNYLEQKRATIITLQEIQKQSIKACWTKAITIAKKGTNAIAVSIDLDVIKLSDAPGVSAGSPNGLTANEIEQVAYMAGKDTKTKMLDIFEMSPLFDIDERTAKLGASIIIYFLKGLCFCR